MCTLDYHDQLEIRIVLFGILCILLYAMSCYGLLTIGSRQYLVGCSGMLGRMVRWREGRKWGSVKEMEVIRRGVWGLAADFSLFP